MMTEVLRSVIRILKGQEWIDLRGQFIAAIDPMSDNECIRYTIRHVSFLLLLIMMHIWYIT